MFFFCLLGFFVISSLILFLKFIITRDHQPFHSKSDLISPIMPVPKYLQSTPCFLLNKSINHHQHAPTILDQATSASLATTPSVTSPPDLVLRPRQPREVPAWATSQPHAQGLAFGTTAQLRATRQDSPCCDEEEATQSWARVT